MKIVHSVIILPVLIILLLVTPVFGSSDWVECETNIYGGNYSYNVNIKHMRKNIVQVWNKIVYSDEGRERYIQNMRDNGMSIEGYENLSETQRLIEIDCKKGMSNILSIIDYDKNGKILISDSYNNKEWNDIRIGSMMDTLRKKVCK
jgi:hypothetical protein